MTPLRPGWRSIRALTLASGRLAQHTKHSSSPVGDERGGFPLAAASPESAPLSSAAEAAALEVR